MELERCRPYIAAELRLLQRVRVVVTLGRIAHETWLKAAGWWDRLAPRVVTSADALEDLLRAARAEALRAPRPWRVGRDAAGGRLRLAIGAEPEGGAAGAPPAAPESLGSFGAARARTDRAAAVLTLAHGVLVARAADPGGATTGIAVSLEDASAKAVGERVAAETDLPPHADAAIRAYLLARERGGDPFGPGGLVAVMGVLRAAERELERVLLPERPAFFVTAGQRGGGKTTCLIMIVLAVTGKRPPAAKAMPRTDIPRLRPPSVTCATSFASCSAFRNAVTGTASFVSLSIMSAMPTPQFGWHPQVS